MVRGRITGLLPGMPHSVLADNALQKSIATGSCRSRMVCSQEDLRPFGWGKGQDDLRFAVMFIHTA